jgi:hypothetical protein
MDIIKYIKSNASTMFAVHCALIKHCIDLRRSEVEAAVSIHTLEMSVVLCGVKLNRLQVMKQLT